MAHAHSVVSSHQDEQNTEEPVTAIPLPPAYTVRIRLPYNDKQAFLDHIGEDGMKLFLNSNFLPGDFCLPNLMQIHMMTMIYQHVNKSKPIQMQSWIGS